MTETTQERAAIDIHVHLLGLQPKNGCKIAKKLQRGPLYQLISRAVGLKGVSPEVLDVAYAERMIQMVEDSQLAWAGVLALDGVYDARGNLDDAATQVMVGNTYCVEVCERSPRLRPVCSINPRRRDAIDELERVVELGSVAIKTLPNSQGFDPLDRAYDAFWQRMADLKIPLLTHTSFEHTIPPIDQMFGLPHRLRGPLEQGVNVIAAHCAGSGVAHPIKEDFDDWLSMLGEYSNLYGDISAMASVSRYPYIRRVLQNALATERVVHGSDFPIPVHPMVFMKDLGFKQAYALHQIENPLDRNTQTFRAMGVPEEVFTRVEHIARLG